MHTDIVYMLNVEYCFHHSMDIIMIIQTLFDGNGNDGDDDDDDDDDDLGGDDDDDDDDDHGCRSIQSWSLSSVGSHVPQMVDSGADH